MKKFNYKQKKFDDEEISNHLLKFLNFIIGSITIYYFTYTDLNKSEKNIFK